MFKGKPLKLICIWCAVLFLVIFGARFVYECFAYETGGGINNMNRSIIVKDESKGSIRNYATSKMEYADAQGGAPQIVDQKYEKVANLSSSTAKYEDDEKKLYDVITNNKCVIQLENKSGLNQNRRAEMVIGVKPDSFDETIKQISKIGKITSSNVTKTDKTAEFKQMLADKATLEKTRESYIALRAKSGNITELLALEQKIIEIEGQIQNQSVNLGEYNVENAFCTVNFSLYEQSKTSTNNNAFTIVRSIWRALIWTVMCYSAVLGLILLTMVFSIVLIKFLGYIKQFLLNINK